MIASPVLHRLAEGLAPLGVDLSSWRPEFLLRRLRRGALLSGDVFVDRHVERILESSRARNAFLDDLSIGVSRFFRDPIAFAALELLLPQLTRSGDPFAALSLGCARGQEAWSLAMLLAEQEARAEVTGFDRDELQLAAAREGSYPFEDVQEVSLGRARAWLQPRGERFEVCSRLRERVRFERADLADPEEGTRPLSSAHPVRIVTCRNLLLYLSEPARERLIGRILATLTPGGFLLLGMADPHQVRPELEAIAPEIRLYRRVAA